MSYGCDQTYSPDDSIAVVDSGSTDATDASVDAVDGSTDDGGTVVDAAADAAVDTASDAAADAGEDAGTDAGVTSPSCTIVAPTAGTNVGYTNDITFTATATDDEEGALSGASVVWSSDLISGSLGTGLSLTRTLGTPGMHTITCTTTDSVGNTGTATVSIEVYSPVAEITNPANGSSYASGTTISFSGRGRDAEDGDLADAKLTWFSSLDGSLGSGSSVQVVLSIGTHIVVLVVEDSAGNQDVFSISVTVT